MIGQEYWPAAASTMAFYTLTMARLFHGFNCRTQESIFKVGFRSNPYSIGAFVAGTALLLVVALIPALHPLFMVRSITWAMAGIVVGLSMIPTILIQATKLLRKKN